MSCVWIVSALHSDIDSHLCLSVLHTEFKWHDGRWHVAQIEFRVSGKNIVFFLSLCSSKRKMAYSVYVSVHTNSTHNHCEICRLWRSSVQWNSFCPTCLFAGFFDCIPHYTKPKTQQIFQAESIQVAKWANVWSTWFSKRCNYSLREHWRKLLGLVCKH